MSDTLLLTDSAPSNTPPGASSSGDATTAPIEDSTTSKPPNDSHTQMEEEEIEVDLHIEGSGAVRGLKRRASTSFEESGQSLSRKRMKEDSERTEETADENVPDSINGRALVDDLVQELECGCCSALVHKPVTVHPCQHFFCGSCCVLWIRNGGTSCPACRAVSTSVTPSRALQSMVDILVHADPSIGRATNEITQADELYRTGTTLRIPMPREPSPEPALPRNSDYAQPCPHCTPGNSLNWTCPQPVADPETNRDNAWLLEDGAPPGHGYCGNCENLLALRAPSTTKCDFCQVLFCGLHVPGRCIALPLRSQHPHGLSDVGDLIQSTEVYECFDNNAIEVDYMLDYLTEQRLLPREIYRDIIEHIQKMPRQFLPLFELELFSDVHGMGGGVGIDPDPTAPRNKICRVCASEILLWGLKDWWIREREKGHLNAHVLNRKDCPNGSACGRQKDPDHAKEFNHIFYSPEAPAMNPEEGPSQSAPAGTGDRPDLHSPPEIDVQPTFEAVEGRSTPAL